MTDRDIMKQALEALKLIDEAMPFPVAKLTIKNLIERLAQPEQEPVAWMFQHDETGRMNYVSNDGIHNPAMFLKMNPRYALVCPLYTAPPQRKPPQFPTMLRKMWSGAEVQKWINENWEQS